MRVASERGRQLRDLGAESGFDGLELTTELILDRDHLRTHRIPNRVDGGLDALDLAVGVDDEGLDDVKYLLRVRE